MCGNRRLVCRNVECFVCHLSTKLYTIDILWTVICYALSSQGALQSWSRNTSTGLPWRRGGGFGISGGYGGYYRRRTSLIKTQNTEKKKNITNTEAAINSTQDTNGTMATTDTQATNATDATNGTQGTNVTQDINGVEDTNSTTYINISKAPWHVGLYTKTTNPYMQICGGTIIAKNVVVTAAHCVTQDRTKSMAELYAVAAGKVYRPWNDPNDVGGQKSDVDAIEIPPRYQGSVGNFQEDIALLILNKTFVYNEFVRPACLNFHPDYDKKQLEGSVGSIVGWGLTDQNSLPSQVLQIAQLPIVPIDKCIDESPTSFRSSITGDKICAGHTNGTAVCRGDSGGGLTIPGIVKRANADPPCFELHVFLRGVASTSPTSENSCNVYTWATFTHLLRHEHFVKTHVPDVEESCVPLMVYQENEVLSV